MIKKMSIIFVVLLLVWGVGGVVALDKQALDNYTPLTTKHIFTINETINHLSHHIDLWHDANLKGDREKIELYEAVIDDIVSKDIAQSKNNVRNYAQLAVLENVSGNEAESQADLNQSAVRPSEVFKGMVSNLNSKKKMAEALQKTKTFSNKFRLLGDYIYLLQQELKMVRIEVANEESETSDVKK